MVAVSAERTFEHVSQREKLSSGVKNFLRKKEWLGGEVGCISSYLAFLPQLYKITKMKTHNCEVVRGAHPSVLTAGSTVELFLGAFFSLREMKESKFLFSGSSVG